MMLKCPRCGHRDHESCWPFWLRPTILRCPKCWTEGLSVPPVKDEAGPHRAGDAAVSGGRQ